MTLRKDIQKSDVYNSTCSYTLFMKTGLGAVGGGAAVGYAGGAVISELFANPVCYDIGKAVYELIFKGQSFFQFLEAMPAICAGAGFGLAALGLAVYCSQPSCENQPRLPSSRC